MKPLLTTLCLAWLGCLGAIAQTAPSELTLTPVLADNQNTVTLRWKDNSNDETGFEVISSTNGTSYIRATTTAANATSYVITLTTSTKNYFRVRAIKGAAQSGYSNTVDYDMGPESPLDLILTVVSSSQIDVKWSDRSTDETGYEIERSTDLMIRPSKIGTVGANVVSYRNTGLLANTTYYYRVRGVKGSAGSAYTHIVSAKTQSAPAAPSPPTSPIISPSLSQNWTQNADRVSEITAAWQDRSDNETGFDIQWGDTDQYSGGSASVDAGATQYRITGSWPGCGHRVYVRVRAKNAAGNSAWSSGSVVTSIALPETPNNVVATAQSSSEIKLTWGGANETYSRESEFIIQHSTNAALTSPTEVKSDQNTDNKTIGGLVANTTYYVRIRTKNCQGESAWSSIVNARTSEVPVVAKPSAPTNLVATATSSSQINLTWTDASANEEGFDLERSTDNVIWGNSVSLGVNTTTYSAIGLTANTKYYFRVRAKNGGGSSDWSNTADATTQTPPVIITRPSAPTNLVATAISSSQINLNWTDASSNEDGFDLERSTDNVTWGNVVNVGINTTTYSATGLTASTKYYFRVRAKNSTDVSDWSNVAEATTQATPIAKPNPPTSLTATTASTSQINLGWTDASTDEESFEIERSTDNVTWGNSISVGANAVLFSATSLTANTRYYFRVRSRKSSAVSDWSNVAEATTQALVAAKPATPTNLRLKATTANQISIEWDDRATDETGYEVSRSADSTGKWEVLKGDLAANSKEYADEPVRSGRKYFYRVRAVRSSDFSDYSNVLETLAPIVNGVDDDPITWQVYPNPVMEAVQIQLNSSATCTAVIRNATGDELLKASLRASGAIRVTELPAGVYFLQVTTSSQSKVFRILKQ